MKVWLLALSKPWNVLFSTRENSISLEQQRKEQWCLLKLEEYAWWSLACYAGTSSLQEPAPGSQSSSPQREELRRWTTGPSGGECQGDAHQGLQIFCNEPRILLVHSSHIDFETPCLHGTCLNLVRLSAFLISIMDGRNLIAAPGLRRKRPHPILVSVLYK